MPLFKIQFVHEVEVTYEGYVEAETEEEALRLEKSEPFDMKESEEVDEIGIDCRDFKIVCEGEEE